MAKPSFARNIKAGLKDIDVRVTSSWGAYVDDYGKDKNGGRKYRVNYRWTLSDSPSKKVMEGIVREAFRKFCADKEVSGKITMMHVTNDIMVWYTIDDPQRNAAGKDGIDAFLNSFSTNALKTLCEDRGVPNYGTKTTLITRLTNV